MKRIFGATVTLAMLEICISSAEAVIKIETATVQSGAAFIKEKGAARRSDILGRCISNHR
jgi:hypothetical protein